MTVKSISNSNTYFTWSGIAMGLLFAAFLISLWSCSTAIGTKEVGFRAAYEQINTNALLTDKYSTASKNVLHRYNIKELFEKDPRETLKFLHRKTKKDNRRDLLFALSELSYYTADAGKGDLSDEDLALNVVKQICEELGVKYKVIES